MNSLDSICRDGANIDSFEGAVAGFAFQSLRLGLRAFFSTYREMKYSLHLFEKSHSDKEKDLNTGLRFFDLSAEVVLHFHHFVELIMKDLLRSEHPLLADRGSGDAVVLKKLLSNEPLSPEEETGVMSIEYREAYKRLMRLIDSGKMSSACDLKFFAESSTRSFLDKINFLRNRIWHRGTYLLRYDALDQFVCLYFLPLLSRIVCLDRYSNKEHRWKYGKLACGFDPLEFLEHECIDYNPGKVAFAKELALAAYENPLMGKDGLTGWFDDEISSRAIAAAHSEKYNVGRFTDCPVCGIKSLVVYDDVEVVGEDPVTGQYDRAFRYTWQVKCHCCSFEINHHLENGSQYGIPVEDYWEGEE